MDIVYFEEPFQDSVEEAEPEAKCCVRRAHQDSAWLCREKLLKLLMLRFDAQAKGTSPRAGPSVDPRDG